MADKKGISKLDEKLISLNIISAQYTNDLALVHKKMNTILKKTGAVLSDEIFDTGNTALRKWLILLSKQGASQEKLTTYLRCGLAHLTYDYIESSYHQISIDDLVTRALSSMKKRKLHTSFFKAPQSSSVKVLPKTPPSAKKVQAIKKKDLPKTTKKTTAKSPSKKPTAAKTVNSKTKKPVQVKKPGKNPKPKAGIKTGAQKAKTPKRTKKSALDKTISKVKSMVKSITKKPSGKKPGKK